MNGESIINITVERVREFYKNNKCYLIADETGIGKTIEAREIIKKLAKDKNNEPFKVLYIASNQLLAKENSAKLKVNDDNFDILAWDRLSMANKANDKNKCNEKKIVCAGITPAVSFFLEGGTEAEIRNCWEVYNDEISKDIRTDDIKEVTNRIVEINNKLKYLNESDRKFEQVETDVYYQLYSFIKDTKVNVSVNVIDEDKNFIFDAIWKEINTKKDLKNKVLKEYLLPKLWEMLVNEYIEPNDEQIKDSIDKFIVEKNLYSFLDYSFDISNIIKKVKELNKNECYMCVLKELNGSEGNIKIKRDNSNILKEKYQYSLELYYSTRAYVETFNAIENSDLNEHKVEIDEESIKPTLKKWIKKGKVLDRFLYKILIDLYEQRLNQQLRLLATLHGIEQYSPDLVILDEFQNYPRLFTKNEQDDNEETRNLEKIMKVALKNGNSKVLMLSATPYAYKNMIDDSNYEEEDYLQHIGIDDIVSYMKEQNENDIDFLKEYREYRKSVESLVEQYGDEIDTENNKTPEYLAEEISKQLYGLGISRNERPLSKYEQGGYGSMLIDPTKVNYEEMYIKIKGESEKARDIRRFMSSPIYYKGGNADLSNESLLSFKISDDLDVNYNYRTRMNKLLGDIFPWEGFIPPIFLPAVNFENTKGVFTKYKDYSKKILFSAYTNVPELIDRITNIEFDDLIKEDIGCLKDIEKDMELFKEIVKKTSIAKELDTEISEDLVTKIAEVLTEIFSTDIAKMIIIKTFKKYDDNGELRNNTQGNIVNCSNYWEKVKTYCKWGGLSKTLEEFFYLYKQEYRNYDNIVEYFNDIKENFGRISVSYTSKSRITNNEIQKVKRAFQSPFYPMNFYLSSVAQEGLDFHWYCDFIIHWNVPSSPIALIQREGRINRYNCYSLRKKLYKDLKEKGLLNDLNENITNTWEAMFSTAEAQKEEIKSKYKDLFPHHLSFECEALPIKRKGYYYPLSEEHFRWRELVKNMETYRSLLGAWNIEELEVDIPDELKERLSKCVIDISPSARENDK